MEPGVREGQRAVHVLQGTEGQARRHVGHREDPDQLPTFAQLGVGDVRRRPTANRSSPKALRRSICCFSASTLPGAHKLEFVVPDSKGGGKLYYDLYID